MRRDHARSQAGQRDSGTFSIGVFAFPAFGNGERRLREAEADWFHPPHAKLDKIWAHLDFRHLVAQQESLLQMSLQMIFGC